MIAERSAELNSRATGGAGVWGMRLGRVPRPSRHAEHRFKVAGQDPYATPGAGRAERQVPAGQPVALF